MQARDPDAQLMIAFRDGDEEALSAPYGGGRVPSSGSRRERCANEPQQKS